MGVAEFNSSGGRLERSVCGRGGRRRQDVRLAEEQLWAKWERETPKLSDHSVAPPGERKAQLLDFARRG